MTDPCQADPTESYSAWIQFAEDQVKQGNEQEFCATCKRWKWPSERCERFEVHPQSEEFKVEDVLL